MKLHRYVDHKRLHIVTKDVISLSISVLLLFRHYIFIFSVTNVVENGQPKPLVCYLFIVLIFRLLE